MYSLKSSRVPDWVRPLTVSLLLAGSASQVLGQAREGAAFLRPPEPIETLLLRDRHFDRLRSVSPDSSHFVVPIEQHFSDYRKMGRKTYRLAMLELVPEANQEWRLSTYGLSGFRLFSLADRTVRKVTVPEGALVSDITWSYDGSRIAFLVHLDQGSQVWTAEVATGRAEPLSQTYVMATLAGRPQRGRSPATASRLLQWTPDGSVLTLLVPPDRGPEPALPPTPEGPVIRRTRPEPTPTRTYPFLLRTPHDLRLFRYYTTSQLALLSQGQPPRSIGAPGMYLEFSLSPDGQYILAERLVEPFSYIVDYSGFPRELEVLDLSGQSLSTLRKISLQEALHRGGGDNGNPVRDKLPREVNWRPDGSGLSLLWRQPRPEEESEDSESREPPTDRLMRLGLPYQLDQAEVLASSKKRFTQVLYSATAKFALARLTGRGEGNRNRHDLVAYDLTAAVPEARVLVGDIDPKDPTAQPGEVMFRTTGNGIRRALLSQDESIFLSSQGYRDDFKHRPFVDRVSIADAARTRVFESAAEAYEEPVAALDNELSQLVYTRESPGAFPNAFLHRVDGTRQALTDNQDPFPEVADCRRIDFEFERRDGLKARGRLTLPVGYRPGTRVPAVFWTYPREYESFQAYRQAAVRSHSHTRFRHLNYRNASELWLTQGYAVVEPDIPIIGADGRYNDNYIAHLVDSMYGAIRKMDQMGYLDVDRLGHGGHSYGAFATANILARTPFFKAGIAGDGAFNRTLTPMTFQRERRFLWEAQETILEMSPFFQADHIDTPLLMYHGAVDNNTGTFLIQSERLMQALTGLGKTAVLYIYPHESHGPRAIETYLDLWARWLDWFDRYVKGEAPEETPPAAAEDRSR